MLILGVAVLNRYDLLSALVRSAARSSRPPNGIVIVDNGGQIQLETLPQLPGLTVIQPSTNIGCSAAWNLVLEHAKVGDQVIISNDDIELGRDTIATMEECAKERAEDPYDWGFAGPIVFACRFALVLMKQALLTRVGWFDENFHPAGYEDIDYYVRVRAAGIPMIIPKETGLTHKGSATIGPDVNYHQMIDTNKRYFVSKWGAEPSPTLEPFKQAFNGSPPTGWTERPIAERYRHTWKNVLHLPPL